MYSLFIDTHSENVIIVLFKDGKKIDMVKEQSHFHHSQIALPSIKELLSKYDLLPNDLNLIMVVNGPGSFTGVRIAVVIAKTMAYSLNIPIKVIDSLLIKAVSLNTNKDIVVVEKEKNGAYIGEFDNNLNVVGNYKYMSSNDYNDFKTGKNVYEDVDIDFDKVYEYLENKEAINPHAVNPLYIKNIGVSNDK